jgi:hypothetical protein
MADHLHRRAHGSATGGLIPMKTTCLRFTVFACAAAFLPAASLRAQATMYGIGDLSGGNVFSIVNDATKVGGVIYAVGGSTQLGTSNNDRAVLWTSTGGLTAIPDHVTHTGTQGGAFATAITPDAAYISARLHNHATTNDARAAHVTRSGMTVINLGGLGGNTLSSAANGLSDDGTILWGAGAYPSSAGQNHLIRYTNTTNSATEILPINGATNMFVSSQAAVSADGNKVAGGANTGGNFRTAGTKAFLYIHDIAELSDDVPYLTGGTWNMAFAMNPAGTRGLLGGNSTANPNGELFFRNSDDTNTTIGSPDSTLTLLGAGFSSDSSVVAAAFQTGASVPASYIYNANGWYSLSSVATSLGADLTGWSNLNILGISADATLVWGNGLHSGNTEGFVLEFGAGQLTAIPEPSTYAALFGAGVLGFAIWRRRKAAKVEIPLM